MEKFGEFGSELEGTLGVKSCVISDRGKYNLQSNCLTSDVKCICTFFCQATWGEAGKAGGKENMEGRKKGY